MSCGEPHEVDCADVLDQVYVYLDGELGEHGSAKIREHLHECGHCLREYGLEEAVKKLVASRCGSEHAPPELKTKVLERIAEVRSRM